MCRNIKVLYNFDPPATGDQILAAATQFVRKISGFATPSAANEQAFKRAIKEVAKASAGLLGSLVTNANPRNREMETAKARRRAVLRFGSAAPKSVQQKLKNIAWDHEWEIFQQA